MASFKYLIFIALAALSMYSIAAEEAPKAEEQAAEDGVRVKKHAYIAAPAPVLAYSAAVPATYPYAYSAYPSYSYAYPAAYPSTYTAATYAAYPGYPYAYAHDDGKYWPGKYEKTYYPAAYKAAYPVAYHY